MSGDMVVELFDFENLGEPDRGATNLVGRDLKRKKRGKMI